MEKMGMEPIYPKRCLSRGGVAKYIHPYLLRNLQITRRNQVWSTDISYIPMQNGFMYLYAIMDVHSRYLLGWRLSNSLSASNAYELLQDCVRTYGAPEIVNSDQGRQFTTAEWERLCPLRMFEYLRYELRQPTDVSSWHRYRRILFLSQSHYGIAMGCNAETAVSLYTCP